MGGLFGNEIPLRFDTPFSSSFSTSISVSTSTSLPFSSFCLEDSDFFSTHECKGLTVIPWILFSITREFSFLLVFQFCYQLSHLRLQEFHCSSHIHTLSLNIIQLDLVHIESPLVSTMKVLNNSSTDGFFSAIG